MDERTSIPVSPPHGSPTTSYWQDPPDASLANYLSWSTVPEYADTVIIGSGITGAAIAYGLLGDGEMEGKEREKVVMLEARQACSGATGRNGGHTKAASYHTFLSHASTSSLGEAIKIARLEYSTIKSLHAFAHSEGIECDLFSGETVDIFYDEGQWEGCLHAIKAMRDSMSPEDVESGAAKYTFWSADEARERFYMGGEETVVGAVSYEAGSISAYKFVIGVLRRCVERWGMGFYTNTPVVKIQGVRGNDNGEDGEEGEGEWIVSTSKGDIRAKRVILATNAYTAFLRPEFHGIIVPLRGQITAHRPGMNMPESGLQRTYSFVYEGGGFDYMIPRPRGSRFEGDIVIGGGLIKGPREGLVEYGTTDDSTLSPEIGAYLTDSTRRYFGTDTWGEDDPAGRIRKHWTGIMGYSNDGLPYIGEVPGEKNLWIAASFQGHGMVMCWLCAKALVSMISGREEGLDSWFPESFKITQERMKKSFTGI